MRKTRLTQEQINEIVNLYNSKNGEKWNQAKLASKFGVSQPTISNVLRRIKDKPEMEKIAIPQDLSEKKSGNDSQLELK